MRSTRSSAEAQSALRALVPDDERVTLRPMFGSLAAFANGQMFMGVVADELFLRLDEARRSAVLESGGSVFEAVPGRPMREYVTLPDWRTRADEVRELAAEALDYALSLPPKRK